jgi:hypothetical protein
VKAGFVKNGFLAGHYFSGNSLPPTDIGLGILAATHRSGITYIQRAAPGIQQIYSHVIKDKLLTQRGEECVQRSLPVSLMAESLQQGMNVLQSLRVNRHKYAAA